MQVSVHFRMVWMSKTCHHSPLLPPTRVLGSTPSAVRCQLAIGPTLGPHPPLGMPGHNLTGDWGWTWLICHTIYCLHGVWVWQDSGGITWFILTNASIVLVSLDVLIVHCNGSPLSSKKKTKLSDTMLSGNLWDDQRSCHIPLSCLRFKISV